ncbi:uncharacterized protein AB675_4712 [Cyphellophora attinorum]|uniref:Clr5 domain-containing protein n=1 Tax=Cyphellophora attinorum TaxID=1664694 RepID=A0A0N0NLB8_9EURO|nr:uncharacterized protein AB675_4712 [Phialophora attinorum]KPI38998.1 hypothetical protein AB675_4712 [Phialophora attinorum]
MADSPTGSSWFPPSRCSTPTTKLPAPNNPPLAVDWENYKPIIVELYRDLNLSLPVVKQRMETEYGFIASERMYKGRFSKDKWNIPKNWRDEHIIEYLANEDQDTIFGRPTHEIKVLQGKGSASFSPAQVWEEAQRRRRDSTITVGSIESLAASDLSDTVAASITALEEFPDAPFGDLDLSIPHTVSDTALSIYNGTKAFIMLSNYLETRLFSVEHLDNFFSSVDLFPPNEAAINPAFDLAIRQHPSLLNQNYARAMALLRNGRPKLASALLSSASHALQHLVVTHHPAFASCFLDAFVELKFESQRGMSGYTTAQDDVSMEQLLFFCSQFCQLFSKRLGREHKISAYVNLKHFEKLLQLRRFDQAHNQFVNHVRPVFQGLISPGPVPKTMRAPVLCYLRRKAHLLSSRGDQTGAGRALRQCVNFAVEWLGERHICVAGNPLMEECFRLIDEIAEFLFRNGHTTKGIDLHSFAIGLCAAVRGECEGKCIRMFSAQLVRYADAGFDDRVRILCVRFPSCWVIVDEHDSQDQNPVESGDSGASMPSGNGDVSGKAGDDMKMDDWETNEVPKPTDHILRCQSCANGPDTQLWCEQHRTQVRPTPQDRVYVRLARECLQDLLNWFGMIAD